MFHPQERVLGRVRQGGPQVRRLPHSRLPGPLVTRGLTTWEAESLILSLVKCSVHLGAPPARQPGQQKQPKAEAACSSALALRAVELRVTFISSLYFLYFPDFLL